METKKKICPKCGQGDEIEKIIKECKLTEGKLD